MVRRMDVKKRVLIVISTLKLGGGAERVASTLGTELNKKHEIHFLTFYKSKEEYNFKGKYTCLNEKFSNSSIIKSIKLFKRAKFIAEYCKKNKIDTTISFMEDSNFPNIMSKTMFKNKSKIIVSERVDPIQNNPKLFNYLIKVLYPKADLIVTVSNGLEKIMFKEFSLKNTKTLYNFKDFDKIKRLSKKNIDIKDKFAFNSNINLISVGRLTKQKGFNYLIKSFAKIKNKNVNLVILGEGELRNNLTNLIKSLGLEKRVFLLGNKKNIYPYISKSDVFIMSSLYEGLPNTLIEAMALNKYCISTDCKTGPREILFPNLKVNEEIKYPFKGKHACLISSSEKRIEQQLEKEMLNVIKLGDIKINNSNLINNFKIDKIIVDWGKLL
jgi:glycosyltransferase involved in cell wall biosynthesis